jgi:hypothetical protein
LAKIEKSLEGGFVLRNINLKDARRKDEVEITFFLHDDMDSFKFLCPAKL